jgi:hypothetical protein
MAGPSTLCSGYDGNLDRLCGAVESAVTATFGMPPACLRATTRGTYLVAFARQSAMYLAHVAFGLSYTAVGRGFGRDRTTAAHACRLIEQRRDDPTVDALLGALEAACHSLRERHACDVEACR